MVDRHTGEVAHLSDHPKTVIQNLLDLDGPMSEHLVGPDDVRRVDGEALAGFLAAAEEERAGKNRSTYVDAMREAPPTPSSAAASCSAWSTATGG